MKIKYKRILAFIGFLIAICGFIGIAYLFYDKVINNESDVIVLEDLSINFLNGNFFSENGTYEFSVTNNGDKDINYNILSNEIKEYDKNVAFSLTSSEAYVNVEANLDKNTNLIAENILIKPGTTQNFVFTISNNTITTFKLDFKINSDVVEYFYATILKNNTIKKEPVTKVGEEVAINNEGLIEDIDDYGITYYFRGNVSNNYVSFANSLWRIVRINGDGTVRLILNTVASDLANYNTDLETYEDLEETSIYEALTSYYETNLKNYEEYIANAKFCKEMEHTSNETEKIYNSYSRLITNKIPTFNCLGEKYGEKIGLMTADEVAYAGANFQDDNKNYYLYNAEIENVWWTSTLAKGNATTFYPFSVAVNGKITDEVNGTLYRYLRPVINLDKKIIVSGQGTLEEPYLINS